MASNTRYARHYRLTGPPSSDTPITGTDLLSHLPVTFTGTLTTLTRDGAERVIHDLGGFVLKNYRPGQTEVLVVGRMPKSGPTEALKDAKRSPAVTILDEADFLTLVPPAVLTRHHRQTGPAAPSSDALTKFRTDVAAAAEAYTLRCVRDFIADELLVQKTIELDTSNSFQRKPEFDRLGKLVAPVVYNSPRNSPAVKEVRATLAKHNLKLSIGNFTGLARGREHILLRFQVVDKRRFLQDADRFMRAGQA